MGKTDDCYEDLNVALNEVRATLEHWGLKEWQEFLLVRRPGKPESFIVLGSPRDSNNFADKLISLHRESAAMEANNAPD